MARKKRKRSGLQVLSRFVNVVATSTRVALYSHKRRGSDPMLECGSWLDIRGTMDEPVRDVNTIVISLHPVMKMDLEPMRSEHIGAVIAVRPELHLVVAMPPAAFSHAWTMALAGQLKHAHCTFTKPRYRSALVTSLAVSSEPESQE